jgi:hypothetical protein
MAIIRISALTPYIDFQIKDVDYIPIITPVVGPTPFKTFRASSIQIARYVTSTITNQQLSSTNDVIFNNITCSTSLSANTVSAEMLYGDGSNLTGLANNFDQTLNKADNVTFNRVDTDTLSCVNLSATNLYINGLQVVSKYIAEINHTGSSTPATYSVPHPIKSQDVIVQIFEQKVIMGGGVSNEVVLASTIHTYDPTTGGQLTINLTNLTDAIYKVVIIG